MLFEAHPTMHNLPSVIRGAAEFIQSRGCRLHQESMNETWTTEHPDGTYAVHENVEAVLRYLVNLYEFPSARVRANMLEASCDI